MTAEQRITIESIPIEPTDAGYTHIDVSLYYDKGGQNWYSSRIEPRGYWVSIQPVKKEFRDYGYINQCNPRDGARVFIKEVSRFSAKTLNELSHDPDIDYYVARFMDRYGYSRITDMTTPAATEADTIPAVIA